MRKGALFLTLLAAASAHAQSGFALKNGDRVVFYGDSITDNSFYTKFAELLVRLRYPNLVVKFFNAGVGGDRVSGGWMGPIDDRLPRDLFSRKPTVITVMLGMNDGAYRAAEPGIENAYKSGYQHIVDRFKKEAPQARVFLIQPSPFDDVTRAPGWNPGYNGVMKTYADFVANLAKTNGYGVVDFNTPVVSMLEKAKAANADVAAKIIPDRVHPAAAGHLVMAQQLLASWGAPPTIGNMTIETKPAKAMGYLATASDLKVSPNKITWMQLDQGLPFPMDRKDPTVLLTLQSGDFDQKMNQEMLTVKDLAEGNYALAIDDKPVATFSSEDLAKGVNLAQYETPMLAQARTVWSMVYQKTDIAYSTWRQQEFTLSWLKSPKKDASIKAANELCDELSVQAQKAAKPVKHSFTLTKQ